MHFYRRIFALALALLVGSMNGGLSNLAEANVWKDRQDAMRLRKSVQVASLPATLPLSSAINGLPTLQSALSISSTWNGMAEESTSRLSASLQSLVDAIPQTQGAIQDVVPAANPVGTTAPPVVLMQDIHMNAEAQAGLAGLLQGLLEKNQIGLVGVEGAFERFDFAPFRSFPEPAIIRGVAEAFMKGRRLAAPSYVGITYPTAVPFFGVDDKHHYATNVRAYLASRGQRNAAVARLTEFERTIAEAKTRFFSAELRRMDDDRIDYHKGGLGFGAYVNRLAARESEHGFTLDQFLSAIRLESQLDFARVEIERRRLIEMLGRRLNPDEMAVLLSWSVAHRMGRLGFGAYYRNLKELCERKGVRLAETPAFDAYVRYALLADGIKAQTLFADVARLEEAAFHHLAKTPEEKEWVQASKWATLMGKLIDFSLTAEEWNEYKKEKTKVAFHSLNLSSFERFYSEADIRSEKMVTNLLGSGTGPKALILGGFHTQQVARLLRERNIPYVIVTPRLTKIDSEAGNAYLSVFAREKTPLDKLFAGEKLFLAPVSQYITSSPTAVELLASAWARVGDAARLAVAPLKFFHKQVLVNIVVRKASDPANDQYDLRREVGVVIKEFLYALPVFLVVYTSSFPGSSTGSSALITVAWILNIVMAVLFGNDHKGYDRKQKAWLMGVGFFLGGVFLVPGLVEAWGIWSILFSMGLHLAYNHLVWSVRLASKRFPWLTSLSQWLPLAARLSGMQWDELKIEITTSIEKLASVDGRVRREGSDRLESIFFMGPRPKLMTAENRTLLAALLKALVESLFDANRKIHRSSVYVLLKLSHKFPSDFFSPNDKSLIKDLLRGLRKDLLGSDLTNYSWSCQVLIEVLVRLPANFFDLDDKILVGDILFHLGTRLHSPDRSVREYAAETLQELLNNSRGFLTSEYLKRILYQDGGQQQGFDEETLVLKLFAQESKEGTTRSFARAVLKSTSEAPPPNISVSPHLVLQYLSHSAASEHHYSVVQEGFVGVWNQYEDMKGKPFLKDIAEEFFWDAISNLMQAAELPPLDNSVNPINLRNAAAAFAIACQGAGILWFWTQIWSFNPVPRSIVEVLPIVLPLFYLGQLLFAFVLHIARYEIYVKPASGRFLPLWGVLVTPDLDAFIDYNSDTGKFHINTHLHALLTYNRYETSILKRLAGFAFRFATHFILNFFLIPLHELLHARAWDNELMAFCVQGLGATMAVTLVFATPLFIPAIPFMGVVALLLASIAAISFVQALASHASEDPANVDKEISELLEKLDDSRWYIRLKGIRDLKERFSHLDDGYFNASNTALMRTAIALLQKPLADENVELRGLATEILLSLFSHLPPNYFEGKDKTLLMGVVAASRLNLSPANEPRTPTENSIRESNIDLLKLLFVQLNNASFEAQDKVTFMEIIALLENNLVDIKADVRQHSTVALTRLFYWLPPHFFQAEDSLYVKTIIVSLGKKLAHSNSTIRWSSVAVLQRLFKNSPALLTTDHLRAIFHSAWGQQRNFMEVLEVIELFGSNEHNATIRSFVQAVKKALTDIPATTLTKERITQYLVGNAADEYKYNLMQEGLSWAWNQYEILKEGSPLVAENFFRQAVENLIEDSTSSPPDDSANPINLRNATAAFVVTTGLSAAAWGLLKILNLDPVSTGGVVALFLILPAFFLVQALFVLILHSRGSKSGSHRPTGPPIMLWGSPARAVSGTSFVTFVAAEREFHLNPALHALLTYQIAETWVPKKIIGFVVRFSTHLVLNIFLVPLHEVLHAKGWKREWVAFGAQRLVVLGAGMLMVTVPLAWGIPGLLVVLVVSTMWLGTNPKIIEDKKSIEEHITDLIGNLLDPDVRVHSRSARDLKELLIHLPNSFSSADDKDLITNTIARLGKSLSYPDESSRSDSLIALWHLFANLPADFFNAEDKAVVKHTLTAMERSLANPTSDDRRQSIRTLGLLFSLLPAHFFDMGDKALIKKIVVRIGMSLSHRDEAVRELSDNTFALLCHTLSLQYFNADDADLINAVIVALEANLPNDDFTHQTGFALSALFENSPVFLTAEHLRVILNGAWVRRDIVEKIPLIQLFASKNTDDTVRSCAQAILKALTETPPAGMTKVTPDSVAHYVGTRAASEYGYNVTQEGFAAAWRGYQNLTEGSPKTAEAFFWNAIADLIANSSPDVSANSEAQLNNRRMELAFKTTPGFAATAVYSSGRRSKGPKNERQKIKDRIAVLTRELTSPDIEVRTSGAVSLRVLLENLSPHFFKAEDSVLINAAIMALIRTLADSKHVLGWNSVKALQILFADLPVNFFKREDKAFNKEIIAALSKDVPDPSWDISQASKNTLKRLFGNSPSLLTSDHLQEILQGIWAEPRNWSNPATVLDAMKIIEEFVWSENATGVQSFARAILKALEESPASHWTPLTHEHIAQYLSRGDAAAQDIFVLAWNQFQWLNDGGSPLAAEEVFWVYLEQSIMPNLSAMAESSANPINIRNATTALGIATGMSVAAWGLIQLWNLDPTSTWSVTVCLLLPVFFLVQALFVFIMHGLGWKMSGHRPTGPPIELWGSSARSVAGTSFVTYAANDREFQLNPALYARLTTHIGETSLLNRGVGFSVRFLTHLLLNIFLIPLHERVHAGGTKSEWIAFGVQGLMALYVGVLSYVAFALPAWAMALFIFIVSAVLILITANQIITVETSLQTRKAFEKGIRDLTKNLADPDVSVRRRSASDLRLIFNDMRRSFFDAEHKNTLKNALLALENNLNGEQVAFPDAIKSLFNRLPPEFFNREDNVFVKDIIEKRRKGSVHALDSHFDAYILRRLFAILSPNFFQLEEDAGLVNNLISDLQNDLADDSFEFASQNGAALRDLFKNSPAFLTLDHLKALMRSGWGQQLRHDVHPMMMNLIETFASKATNDTVRSFAAAIMKATVKEGLFIEGLKEYLGAAASNENVYNVTQDVFVGAWNIYQHLKEGGSPGTAEKFFWEALATLLENELATFAGNSDPTLTERLIMAFRALSEVLPVMAAAAVRLQNPVSSYDFKRELKTAAKESVYFLPAYLLALVGPLFLPDPAMTMIGLLVNLGMSLWFGFSHKADRDGKSYSWGQKSWIAVVGLVLGGIFFVPDLMKASPIGVFFLSMGLHLLYNHFVWALRSASKRFSWLAPLAKWLPLAQWQPSATRREEWITGETLPKLIPAITQADILTPSFFKVDNKNLIKDCISTLQKNLLPHIGTDDFDRVTVVLGWESIHAIRFLIENVPMNFFDANDKEFVKEISVNMGKNFFVVNSDIRLNSAHTLDSLLGKLSPGFFDDGDNAFIKEISTELTELLMAHLDPFEFGIYTYSLKALGDLFDSLPISISKTWDEAFIERTMAAISRHVAASRPEVRDASAHTLGQLFKNSPDLLTSNSLKILLANVITESSASYESMDTVLALFVSQAPHATVRSFAQSMIKVFTKSIPENLTTLTRSHVARYVSAAAKNDHDYIKMQEIFLLAWNEYEHLVHSGSSSVAEDFFWTYLEQQITPNSLPPSAENPSNAIVRNTSPKVSAVERMPEIEKPHSNRVQSVLQLPAKQSVVMPRYSFKRELKTVIQESVYFLPAYLTALLGPLFLPDPAVMAMGLLFNLGMSLWFGFSHKTDRDDKPYSGGQKSWISVVGFVLGGIFFVPGLMEASHGGVFLLVMGLHLLYNHGVGWLKKMGLSRPWLKPFADWVPWASIGAGMDQIKILQATLKKTLLKRLAELQAKTTLTGEEAKELRFLNKELKATESKISGASFLVSKELRAAVVEKSGGDDQVWMDPVKLKALVSADTYLNPENEWMIGIMFVLLRSEASLRTIGLEYEKYRDVLRGNLTVAETYFYGVIMEHRSIFFEGVEAAELTERDIDAIIDMSVELFRKAREIMAESEGLSGNALTIRELMRFYVDFSLYYLRSVRHDGTHDLGDIIRQFVLTAHNIYGRVLETPQARTKFIDMLYMMLAKSKSGARIIFRAEQLKQFSSEGGREKIREIMDFADYEHTERARTENTSDFEASLDALIDRSYQVARPLLLVTRPDDALIVEDALSALDKNDGRTVRFSASAFAKRKDLFGMLMPRTPLTHYQREKIIAEASPDDIFDALVTVFDIASDQSAALEELAAQREDVLADESVRASVAMCLSNPLGWRNAMDWHDGFLMQIARQASKDSQHRYTIIIDNAEALPGRVRVLLNPVLWEKHVNVPDRGESVQLAANVQFIFTMDESSVIRDDSFLNRVLVHFTGSFGLSKKGYIAKKTGVSPEIEARLLSLYAALKATAWQEDPDWNFSDAVHMGLRVAGRLRDNPTLDPDRLLAQEAEAFLKLRLGHRDDWNTLQTLLEKLGIHAERGDPDIRFAESGNLVFDGVEIETGETIRAYRRQHPMSSVEEVFNRVYGFALSEMEKRVLSQFARDWKYGLRSVELEGPSGEGKTEISRVFSKVVGLRVAERTINAETDLADLRGRFAASRDGSFRFEEAGYVREMEQGSQAHIFNEINTAADGRIYNWLYPEIARYVTKTLPEFASADKLEQEVGTSAADENVKHNPLRQVSPHRDNMRFFTVNSEGTAGRNPMPRRLTALIPRYHLSADPAALPALARQFFNNDPATASFADKYAPVLAEVHRTIWNAQNTTNQIESAQPVTRRFLLRVIERIKVLQTLDSGLSDPEIVGRAVREIYGLPWKNLSDIKKALSLIDPVLEKHGVPRVPVKALEALRLSLSDDKPTLVFGDASDAPAGDVAQQLIRDVDANAAVARIPLGFFHNNNQWVGAWMPRPAGILGSLLARLIRRKFPKLHFEVGLIGSLIKEARLRAARPGERTPESDRLYAILENYSQLNEKTMPFLNEFLQTGELEALASRLTPENAEELLETVEQKIAAKELDFKKLVEGFSADISLEKFHDDAQVRLNFARWFYTRKPINLKLVATASSQEDVKIGGPELDRFTAVNIARRQDDRWVKDTVDQWFEVHPLDLKSGLKNEICEKVIQALAIYRKQADEFVYDHIRFSVDDVQTLLSELLIVRNAHQKNDRDFEKDLNELAYYVLGIGLRPPLRDSLRFTPDVLERPQDGIGFRQEPGKAHWIFYADGVEIETRHPVNQPAPTGFLAATENHVRQMASLIIAWRHNRVGVIEGYPGGGKSALIPELAKRLGVPQYDELMYDGIDLGGFLGRLSKKGGELVLTARPNEQGEFFLSFLNAYQHGGAINLDEGAVGASSQKVIAYLTALASLPELDLSYYHPGTRGPPLVRHPDFRLFITQNPAGITKDRLSLPYDVDARGHKIWTDNTLSMPDALRIINHHLNNQAQRVPEKIKTEMARLHLEFLKHHPAKDELSPRQLILMAQGLRALLGQPGHHSESDMARTVFRGAMVAYFERLSAQDRDKLAFVLGDLSYHYMHEWRGPIDVTRGKMGLNLGGVALAASASPSNVDPSDIRFPEDTPSQNATQRALAYGLSLGMPVALLEPVGANALDLVRKFALKTNRELEILWSHPDMTRSQLVASLMPRFEPEFNEWGVRQQDNTGEFRQALGFLTSHMMTREEYARVDPTALHKQKILFFHMMDAIPERQRVVLNLFLSRMGRDRTLMVEDTDGRPVTYVLPPWVGLVVSAPVEHQFSSAFMNRFLPVRVEPFDYDEMRELIRKRYPYVDDREFDWLWSINRSAVAMDAERQFEVRYGFSPEDMFKLASAVQDLKRQTWRPLKQDPLYYLLRATQLVYLSALKEEDLATFESVAMVGDLLGSIFEKPLHDKTITRKKLAAYYARMKADVFEDFAQIQTHSVRHEIPLASLSETEDIMLPNGLRWHFTNKAEGKITLVTPARSYAMTLKSLKLGHRLTNEMMASLNDAGTAIVFDIDVLDRVGGFELPHDPWNYDRAVPIHEAPTGAFMEMTPEHTIFLAGVANAWQSRADKTAPGPARPPRVAMINGETGVAKTAGMVNCALISGTPVYVLNSYEDMRISDVMASMGVFQGKIQVGVKELLARIGKIRPKGSQGPWQKIRLPGKTTASRAMVIWDEANVSPSLLYALAPLLRGEKRFDFHYAGEVLEVEIEDEVLFAMTFNPSETYGDRASFAPEMAGYAHKFWPANPVRYPDDRLKTILKELTRRGVRSVHEALERRTLAVAPPEREEHIQNVRRVIPSSHADTAALDAAQERAYVETLHRYPNPDQSTEWLRAIDAMLTPVGEPEPAEEPEEGKKIKPDPKAASHPPRPAPKDFKLDYDLAALSRNAARFGGAKIIGDFLDYGKNVIAPFLQAVSDRQFIDDTNAAIASDVFASAGKIDSKFENALRSIFDMYLKGHVDEVDLKENIMTLRRVLAAPKHDVYLIAQEVIESRTKAPYLFVKVEKIQDRFDQWSQQRYDTLGIAAESPLRKKPLPQALILETSPEPGVLGYFEGEFMLAFAGEIRKSLPGHVDLKTAVGWTVFHEIGHMIDQQRYREEGYPIPDNIELNSMLFPLIFGGAPVRYLEHLREWLASGADSDDVYVQASKGILNGMWQRLEEVRSAPASDPEWITDAFEANKIKRVVDALRALPEDQIRGMAAYIYQRRAQYLATAKPGFVKTTVSKGGSGWAKEFMAGVDKGYPQKIVGTVEGQKISVDSQSGKERPSFTPEPGKKSDGKGGGGEGGEEGEDPGEGNSGGSGSGSGSGRDRFPDVNATALDLPKISPTLLRRFIDLFAGSPKAIKYLSDEGDEINLEEWMRSMGASDFFEQSQIVRAVARGHFAVTVDVSGSTHGEVNKRFVEMARQFVALFHRAAVTNKDIRVGLAAHGDDYYPLLLPRDSDKPSAVKRALGKLKAHPANDGNDFQKVIEAIVKQHKNDGLPKLEIVITDGQVTVDHALLETAHKNGVDIVIIGYDTPQVLQFPKSLNLPATATATQMLELLVRVAELKARKSGGMIPFDHDLAQRVQPEGRALETFVQGDSSPPSEESVNPINQRNATLAFVIASALSMAGWFLMRGWNLDPVFFVTLPIFFFVQVGVVWSIKAVVRISPEISSWSLNSVDLPLMLWGSVAQAVEGTSFVEYDASRREFLLNPTLHRLLTFNIGESSWKKRITGFIVRCSTHALLTALLVPLHEGVHVTGLKNEGAAFGVQGLAVLGLVTVIPYHVLFLSLLVVLAILGWFQGTDNGARSVKRALKALTKKLGQSNDPESWLQLTRVFKESFEKLPDGFFTQKDKPLVVGIINRMLWGFPRDAERGESTAAALYGLFEKLPDHFFNLDEEQLCRFYVYKLSDNFREHDNAFSSAATWKLLEKSSINFFEWLEPDVIKRLFAVLPTNVFNETGKPVIQKTIAMLVESIGRPNSLESYRSAAALESLLEKLSSFFFNPTKDKEFIKEALTVLSSSDKLDVFADLLGKLLGSFFDTNQDHVFIQKTVTTLLQRLDGSHGRMGILRSLKRLLPLSPDLLTSKCLMTLLANLDTGFFATNSEMVDVIAIFASKAPHETVRSSARAIMKAMWRDPGSYVRDAQGRPIDQPLTKERIVRHLVTSTNNEFSFGALQGGLTMAWNKFEDLKTNGTKELAETFFWEMLEALMPDPPSPETSGEKLSHRNSGSPAAMVATQLTGLLKSPPQDRTAFVAAVTALVQPETVFGNDWTVAPGRGSAQWPEVAEELRGELRKLIDSGQLDLHRDRARIADLLAVLDLVLTDQERTLFVGSLQGIFTEARFKDARGAAVWVDTAERAVSLARSIPATEKLVLGVSKANEASIRQGLSQAGLDPRSLAHRLDIVVMGDDVSALTFIERAKSSAVFHGATGFQIRLLIMDGVTLPRLFFQLNKSEQDRLIHEAVVFFITRTLGAIEIGSHFHDWQAERMRLMQA